MILEYDSASRLSDRGRVVVNRSLAGTTWSRAIRRLSGRLGMVLTLFVVATAIAAPFLTRIDPFALAGDSLVAPNATHWMGTDALGRDLFSGIVFGARTSLVVAAAVSALAFIVGMVFGLVGGYVGGWVDDVLLRLTELTQVLPRFFLVIVVVALWGPGMDHLVWTLAIASWPLIARVVRGEVLALRQLDFVVAAEASGASISHILWRVVLPNVLPGALVIVGLLFGQVILIESSLGFLGLGDPNAMSWGLLAGQAQPLLRVAWWLSVFPGLAITSAVLGINLLADALSTPRR